MKKLQWSQIRGAVHKRLRAAWEALKKPSGIETAIFLVFIFGLTAVNIFTADRTFSPIENRNLKQRPVFSWEKLFSGKFMEDYEEYITDQFAERDGWTALKAGSERVLGKRKTTAYTSAGIR